MPEKYTITLDKERELVYTNRSFRELEKLSGKPILGLLFEVFNTPENDRQEKMITNFLSSEFLTNFIYVGQLHNEKKLSLNEVVEIIPVSKYNEIFAFCMKVILTEFGFSSGKGEAETSGDEKKS